MRIELSNKLDELPNVVTALEAFSVDAHMDKAATQAAELALDELLTNIISYGYPDADRHKIFVELSVDRDTLKIVVSDDGIAFNLFEQQEPDQMSSIDQQKLGGFGIHLVKKFMDEYFYQRQDGCNVITLLKYLKPGEHVT